MPVGENGYQAGNLWQGKEPAKKKGRYARPFRSRNGCLVDHQDFQGALPEAHSSSSTCLSRSVSIGCQKPV